MTSPQHRSFDGSYAECALLPSAHVFAVETDAPWDEVGAVPETYFTAYGSLFEGLQLHAADHVLVRGATSALGLAAVQLAKSIGCTMLGTTRRESRLECLRRCGVDWPTVDDESLDDRVRAVRPDGVDKVLELVWPGTLRQSMCWLAWHGIACSAGVLGHQFASRSS